MSVRPITPSDAGEKRVFPDGVLTAFNELIEANYDGGEAIVKQPDAVREIRRNMNCTAQDVYDKGWLNVEDVYRAAGWKVEYDKPGYNENYTAFFRFKRKR
jgi:hypothetical protein